MGAWDRAPMCDARQPAPAPRWGALYSMLLIAGAAAVIVDLGVPPPARGAVSYAIGAAAASGAVWWIGWNRVALDQADWCACASATTRVRVIPSVRDRTIVPVVAAVPVLDAAAGAGAVDEDAFAIAAR